MKKIIVIVILLFIITACGRVTEEDLIGGEWVGTAGYENGEIEGESSCYPFEGGVRFIDDEHAIGFDDREYNYILSDRDDDFYLLFIEIDPRDTNFGGASYLGEMISNDEMGWESSLSPEKHNCYLERKSAAE